MHVLASVKITLTEEQWRFFLNLNSKLSVQLMWFRTTTIVHPSIEHTGGGRRRSLDTRGRLLGRRSRSSSISLVLRRFSRKKWSGEKLLFRFYTVFVLLGLLTFLERSALIGCWCWSAAVAAVVVVIVSAAAAVAAAEEDDGENSLPADWRDEDQSETTETLVVKCEADNWTDISG